MRTLVTEYTVWNLWIQRPFDLAGYTWTPFGGFDGYAELTRQLLASLEDVRTVTVTQVSRAGDAGEPAVLWDSGRPLDDCLLLLSLGQGRSVHWRRAAWELRDGEAVVEQGSETSFLNRTLASGERAISPFEVEPFLTTALEVIAQSGWPQATGFIPAVHWYLASISSTVPDLRFLSAWHALETVARRNGDTGQAAGDPHAVACLAVRFRSRHDWDFLTDDLVGRWAELACDVALRRPEERVFPPRDAYILTRKLQLAVLLVLLELVGTRNFARRDSLLRDIRR